MNKTGSVFGLLLLLLLIGCKPKALEMPPPPDDLIPYDTMVDIMVDLRLMDAILLQEQKKGSSLLNEQKFYLFRSIEQKYGITRDRFDRSFAWYQNDLELLDKMFADAITRLVKMKEETVLEKE